ncbi:MAG: aminotransferase class III-fold pyridoxal phosphate-dependent enzyme [Candidatus Micrarchaeia archaeon]
MPKDDKMIKITKRINDIIARDKKLFINTTREPYPFVAHRGEGDFAYDIEGNKFIDFSSFIAVYAFGINGNYEIRNAIKKQADMLSHTAFTDYYSELQVNFGELLIKMLPKDFGRLFLSNSGTEANEAALKFAKLFSNRPYTIAYFNAFHGRTEGSLAMTASKLVQRDHFGPFVGTVHVPFPYCYRCPFKLEPQSCGFACIDYIKNYPLSKEVNPKEVNSFFIEPIQGEGGYIVPPKGYFKELRNLLDDNGILLVDDEVQAGYMRTGKFFALDNFGVTADIYTMAKAAGGGMPLGITITRSSLGNIEPGAHATTFGGNSVSVAAAYASLKYLKRNKHILERQIVSKGRHILKRLNEMKERYELIGDVRGIGLMIGIELVKDRKSKEPAVKERELVITDAFKNGLLLLPAGVSTIRIVPPLNVNIRNIDRGLDILEQSIKRITFASGVHS